MPTTTTAALLLLQLPTWKEWWVHAVVQARRGPAFLICLGEPWHNNIHSQGHEISRYCKCTPHSRYAV